MRTIYNTMKAVTGSVLGCLLLGVVSLPAQAATPRVYDVEIIFFINNASYASDEQSTASYQDSKRRTGILRQDQFTDLPQSRYSLAGIRDTLARSGNYTILFHRAWRQQAQKKSRSLAYPLHSVAANGRDRIEGEITLVLERFLHLEVNAQLVSTQDGTAMAYPDSTSHRPVFELHEKRRIKTRELHYFDNPRFGMIAQVTPYSPASTKNESGNRTETSSASEQIQREIDRQISESSPVDDQLTR